MGVKPTYGRVSRYGLIAYGSSLDCVGPLARTVEDAALLLGAISGEPATLGPGRYVSMHMYSPLCMEMQCILCHAA